MRDQVNSNPTRNEDVTVTSYTIISTGASGTVTVSGSQDISSLAKGSSVIMSITGGSAQGFTTLAEYYVIPVNATSFKIASSQENALTGTYLTSASGNAGAGTLYPNYDIRGILYIGTGGTLNVRGLQNEKTGSTAFSLLTNLPDGSILPFKLKDVNASGLSAVTGLSKWY